MSICTVMWTRFSFFIYFFFVFVYLICFVSYWFFCFCFFITFLFCFFSSFISFLVFVSFVYVELWRHLLLASSQRLRQQCTTPLSNLCCHGNIYYVSAMGVQGFWATTSVMRCKKSLSWPRVKEGRDEVDERISPFGISKAFLPARCWAITLAIAWSTGVRCWVTAPNITDT